MRRLTLTIMIMALALTHLPLVTPRVYAQTDSCALLQVEADALLAKAQQSTGTDAKLLKESAQFYTVPCAGTISEESLIKVWGYDAAIPNEFTRWVQYGLWSETGEVIGSGDEAFFQLTIPDMPKGKFSGVLTRTEIKISNLLTYIYQGKEYLIYVVPLADKIRALPLIKKGRQTSQFFDPLSGELIEWEANWRTLQPIIIPNVAVEFSFRFRLDTPESFIKAYISDLGASQVTIQISPDSMSIQTLEESTTAVPIEVNSWYSVRLLVASKQMVVYLDGARLAEVPLENFVMSLTVPGFRTSAAPATISLDDIEVKTNSQHAIEKLKN